MDWIRLDVFQVNKADCQIKEVAWATPAQIDHMFYVPSHQMPWPERGALCLPLTDSPQTPLQLTRAHTAIFI